MSAAYCFLVNDAAITTLFFFSLHVEAKKHALSHTKLHTQDDRYSTVYDTRRVILHICSCSLS